MDKLSVWWIDTPFRKWFLDRVTRKFYFEYFDELKGKAVLEIGCGSGAGANTILKYFFPEKIVATDLDPGLIAVAKKNAQSKRITVEQADATKLDYKDENFDAVFEYGVIHHIPTPEWKECLNEMYRVLKPGGMVFLWDLSIESFHTIYGKIIKLLTVHPYDKMYKKEEFIDHLVSIGFKIIKRVKGARCFIIVAKK